MNTNDTKTSGATPLLIKVDPTAPALIVAGPQSIAIRGGTTFAGVKFGQTTALPAPAEGFSPGDYGVMLDGELPVIERLFAKPQADKYLGGFHYAPGGNATARAGGDSIPQINPFSVWDANFRPACPDPRGMTFIPSRNCWVDIYLLGAEHMKNGTSAFDQVIADGNDTPMKPDGEDPFEKLDYETAVAVMKHHGKGLLSFEDFVVAAFGVTEKSATSKDPKKTRLDAPRTSKFGLMQATGNMWQWGHDGDPDLPRASLFGGSWMYDDDAGSRYAYVAYHWPGSSNEYLGARGRGDHLQLG